MTRLWLEARFRTNLARRFAEKHPDANLAASLDPSSREATPVNDYVELFVI